MYKNPLLDLEALGQSVWLDYLRRNALDNGELQRLIDKDGLTGLTSNPSIFEKAIAENDEYDDAIHGLASQGKSVVEIYQALTVEDIQLEDEGVQKFNHAFKQLMTALQQKQVAAHKEPVER